MTILRSERYGFIDFISSCGGLMGLFLGVSIFSVFEMAYFCVCQLFHRMFRREDTPI
jgi:amiloride-sensitive sodium channel